MSGVDKKDAELVDATPQQFPEILRYITCIFDD